MNDRRFETSPRRGEPSSNPLPPAVSLVTAWHERSTADTYAELETRREGLTPRSLRSGAHGTVQI